MGITSFIDSVERTKGLGIDRGLGEVVLKGWILCYEVRN